MISWIKRRCKISQIVQLYSFRVLKFVSLITVQ